MCHALADGHNVKISGFGSFILRDKGERVGRNPKTGVEVPIAPRRVMTFRASQIMRDRIAQARDCGGDRRKGIRTPSAPSANLSASSASRSTSCAIGKPNSRS